ncbi:PLP-dependent aminotransferase family protein [Marinomonas mediterranea]|jgi:transcriptional regulator, GntR family|uniref:Transcriptional regulator, GntR family with aminotransferase domain n=1 Tax=Marinomonas mediterranea (strain ATCC 700492 / JCM 21426 / NBRC 103028 / MMB-1) TaxID=717774 RepID=F2K2W6_MARM1|nr:PLP-dependent aminotransferase family protein [Marinomonas mediterranea]ADZ92355.1 transcriptional regulator, GntR family with aminotransferase domain [Marinomonas mediterranea MMB-1]WCN10308.1 aminotransferase class I/II-fold pyridoxal phosphate-dependent enzyme [Marinomonas mediterranea]WCN14352.1 aminotransferase class I/II-fold pyridoxal phosphate-dependent enzyme [Marinomonas mediterranea]WCN18404.1 aminotransferase class I/II-fold pyridoxal phosphate-dependent enzyme [Marinomonas medit
MTLYSQLADRLREHIKLGFFKSGDKLPSVRQLANEHGVSISTVQEAYRTLEMEQLVEARPKSGYFVPETSHVISMPKLSRPPQRPLDVSLWEDVLNMLLSREKEAFCQLQHAMPDMQSKTLKPLLKSLYELNKNRPHEGMVYGDVRGDYSLREQLTRLTAASGCILHPNDIVITSGCQEALSVCLKAVTKGGDIIAVESPGFYGAMQAIKAADLKALEIPTDPSNGMSIEALQLALDQWPIKAILVTPTVNNPLGYVMPEEKKKALYQLAQEYDIAIIEDDIYGDMVYEFPRPKSIKAYDEDGRVLLCSSFSKTLAPGFRVGWIAPGRYRNNVTHIKYVSSSMCPTLPQIAIANFIRQGGYDKHIRVMRKHYKEARDKMLNGIKTYFPSDTLVSYPEGGFVLWVELPERYDAVKLSEKAQEHGVHVAPGQLFSATGKYRNCLRLNYCDRTPEIRLEALKILGNILLNMNTLETKQQKKRA